MKMIEVVEKLDYDLKESMILSNLMNDFPPISKQDAPEVYVIYVYEHF